jgi:hypothetical protein
MRFAPSFYFLVLPSTTRFYISQLDKYLIMGRVWRSDPLRVCALTSTSLCK